MIMNSTRSLFKFVFAVVIFAAVVQNKSYAGGFPVRPGRLILSPAVTYFFADKEWDSTGVKKSFPNNGKFNSVTYSLYAEYGISRRFSVVGYVPYIVNSYKANGQSFPSSGVTDMEVGLKYYLANINYIDYFSLQGTAITPLYNNTLLGYDEEGAELKLSFAGSGTVFNRNYYFNIDNAARQYFGNSGPFQYRYNGTFGLSLDQKFENQLSVAVGGFYSVSDDKQFIITNPTIARDFRFTQVSLTYGHAFSKEVTVLLTGGQFITGRNTGDGTSVTLSFAFRLFN
jgi:protein XagA